MSLKAHKRTFWVKSVLIRKKGQKRTPYHPCNCLLISCALPQRDCHTSLPNRGERGIAWKHYNSQTRSTNLDGKMKRLGNAFSRLLILLGGHILFSVAIKLAAAAEPSGYDPAIPGELNPWDPEDGKNERERERELVLPEERVIQQEMERERENEYEALTTLGKTARRGSAQVSYFSRPRMSDGCHFCFSGFLIFMRNLLVVGRLNETPFVRLRGSLVTPQNRKAKSSKFAKKALL